MVAVKLETGETYFSVVPEGVYEGQATQIGDEAAVDVGNVLPLGRIPEGTMVCNIELSPGDGGKLVRASGAYATVVTHTPSKKTRYVNGLCRARLGWFLVRGVLRSRFLRLGLSII
jgi:large subunit ribosomal protein L2